MVDSDGIENNLELQRKKARTVNGVFWGYELKLQ